MEEKLSKGMLSACLALFAGSLLTGYLADGALSPSVMEVLESQFAPILELPPISLTAVIFLNNVVKTLAAMLLGLALGIPPILFLFSNGFLLGLVSFEVVQSKGILFLLAGVIPHGVFEVPAALLSAALGIKLGKTVFRRLRGGEADVRASLAFSLHLYLKWVPLLLAIAAVMEVFVTSLLLEML